jgi:hypothetical protein
VVIIDYRDPPNPTLVSTVHIQGQHVGETYLPEDNLKPDGTPRVIMCHEIDLHNGRLYVVWRDAGMVIVDVTDRAHPAIISTLDYVPPYNGGHSPGSAAHTSAPVVLAPDQHPIERSNVSRLGSATGYSPSSPSSRALARHRSAPAPAQRAGVSVQPLRLDFLIPMSEAHLRWILREWTTHYNQGRPHSALGPGVPDPPTELVEAPKSESRYRLAADARVLVKSILGGLHHEYSLAIATADAS